MPGDYTGDGITDIAVWRPSTGEWFILRSENGSYYSFPFGANGDTPAPGDYDGDGKTDVSVWRETEGNFYILKTTGGGALTVVNWGFSTDQPIAAYDVH